MPSADKAAQLYITNKCSINQCNTALHHLKWESTKLTTCGKPKVLNRAHRLPVIKSLLVSVSHSVTQQHRPPCSEYYQVYSCSGFHELALFSACELLPPPHTLCDSVFQMSSSWTTTNWNVSFIMKLFLGMVFLKISFPFLSILTRLFSSQSFQGCPISLLFLLLPFLLFLHFFFEQLDL